ncbi:putative eukaryotic translation initiation factor 3 subunit 7 [Toxoplasma gondii TgCatPRC2]|uniref:Eukaryotic translation initiation factor 3 subunit 7, putative n=18 Tax=Toxoplasma gondii TaxID=5811 RepID=A0A125YUR1_TOXGM|nr:eukaryotic translation initiation factor 3 subunit 7, putative [Toxoplasma gondii ME49]EPR56895.1 putative eukaryotic translation initiation factor 3 subunit 7 [Toxoplasma gondii GT1]KFG27802.1 putative eukaryotic translation initiation factor 3 subunit 7 [Toxoplasma gondii p89]KFG29351.1 putative eukaryotic translation initiation factor 3 subunit 7 [Toxoplasma gondii GAB2-2007-GAL-DOM2]KFG56663.1 putative eukaryotic translation initiation factor 3 subunit 7 [Toxoplasma gondii RUB]KYF38595.|eukprot:XP_018637926.1 eukaryotic translation initiation factor 3 subunit 7, putative [Toxoplasma gondii ME49]
MEQASEERPHFEHIANPGSLFGCHPQSAGWGPSTCDKEVRTECLAALAHLPFEPNVRPSLFSHQLFRACDFTFHVQQRQRDGRDPRGITVAFADEEQQFQTVDNRPLLRRGGGGGWLHKRRAPVKQSTAAFNEKNKEEEELRLGKKGKSEQKKQQQQQQARFARIHARHRAFSEWSVQPTNEWAVEAEIPLSQLYKHAVESGKIKVKDLAWRGELRTYNKQADQIRTKLPVALQNLSSNFDYYWVTTQDDDLIKEQMLNSSEPIDVAATDQVLACLMAAPQSKYSWHLHLTKVEGKLLIDKANGSIVDLLTVNETASEPPMQDAENRLNRPAALGFEAVKINQNLRQQLLVKGEEPVKFSPPPFVEAGDNPASIAYRYRMFTIPGRTGGTGGGKSRQPINIITRTEVNAKLPQPADGSRKPSPGDEMTGGHSKREKEDSDPFGKDGGGYVYICALNEYDIKGQRNWRVQMETQRGALLATEVRNNACKLKKFVASAMMAGCDDLKLGFVSRKANNDNEHHVVLSVQSYQTRDLGMQIGLKPDNAWGIVRAIVDMVMEKPDGRYVLLKDPTKPVMRLYSRPEEEDEDAEEEEKAPETRTEERETNRNDEE